MQIVLEHLAFDVRIKEDKPSPSSLFLGVLQFLSYCTLKKKKKTEFIPKQSHVGFWKILKEKLVCCFGEVCIFVYGFLGGGGVFFLFFPFLPLLLHESMHKKPLKTPEPVQKIILSLRPSSSAFSCCPIHCWVELILGDPLNTAESSQAWNVTNPDASMLLPSWRAKIVGLNSGFKQLPGSASLKYRD